MEIKMKKIKMLVVVLFLMFAFAFTFVGEAVAATTTVSVADSSGANGDRVKVPINVAGASNLGAMSISLTYDSSVLKGIEADSGELATNALVESNEIEAGKMLISFADTRGISGDGTILEVTFEVIGDPGASTQIAIEAEGYDVDLLDVPLETAPGTFRVVEKGMGLPIIPIIIAVIIVLVILVLIVKKRSKKKGKITEGEEGEGNNGGEDE
ncbi:MAG: hypothetical protein KAT65_07320 [Methanophagales archaeon]|nr:hypothetical protein [Methanophagales archaeon]